MDHPYRILQLSERGLDPPAPGVKLFQNGWRGLLSLKQYAALTDDVELAMDKVNKAADLSNLRYSGQEVSNRVRGRTSGPEYWGSEPLRACHIRQDLCMVSSCIGLAIFIVRSWANSLPAAQNGDLSRYDPPITQEKRSRQQIGTAAGRKAIPDELQIQPDDVLHLWQG